MASNTIPENSACPAPPATRNNPFWDFSLKLYASPAVQTACLDLQDDCGVDVNVLLYMLWQASPRLDVGEHNVTAGSDDVATTQSNIGLSVAYDIGAAADRSRAWLCHQRIQHDTERGCSQWPSQREGVGGGIRDPGRAYARCSRIRCRRQHDREQRGLLQPLGLQLGLLDDHPECLSTACIERGWRRLEVAARDAQGHHDIGPPRDDA